MFKKLFCYAAPAFIFGMFFGNIAGKDSAEQVLYDSGYLAAMNHVADTIKRRMPELEPFYMADLGIRFIPRGNNIATMKFIGAPAANETVASAQVKP